MRPIASVASVLFIVCLMAPTVGEAAPKQPAHSWAGHSRLSARVLSQRMEHALVKSSHIQVQGTASQAGQAITHYLLRYQSGGRESLSVTGGAYGRVQIGKRRLSGVRTVTLGKTTYRTLDGSRWTRISSESIPSAQDAVSLPVHVPCCLAPGGKARIQLADKGLSTWNGKRVYVLTFRRADLGQLVTGSVMLDAHSFLPLAYSEISQPPLIRGNFTLTYGGSFTISAPR